MALWKHETCLTLTTTYITGHQNLLMVTLMLILTSMMISMTVSVASNGIWAKIGIILFFFPATVGIIGGSFACQSNFYPYSYPRQGVSVWNWAPAMLLGGGLTKHSKGVAPTHWAMLSYKLCKFDSHGQYCHQHQLCQYSYSDWWNHFLEAESNFPTFVLSVLVYVIWMYIVHSLHAWIKM